ncbi:hypothetical protein M427DRAFT_164976 [Gonapodya prolifera JEL478]|uniref:Uncharacterized protein n=1 Tax=Gonapodya prolifera (strain JEL478) TaxID=1344416 RepID=A0A139AZX9_GONPJ|nr:hypothetical protein M427DRAFT_164976 [Gonapodya prolifera JEL478]|eukprot:KXS22113.1 hypothetical protein M427DRAFT_164976 [Gonapodya prolifera JEL478]
MAAQSPQQSQPPSPLYSSQPFPYPTVFYINPQNAIHLDLRGVRFKVDLAILRLFPESILLTMFGQTGQFPILALLQGAARESGIGGVVAGQHSGILVNSSATVATYSGSTSDMDPNVGSTNLVRKPSYVPPMTRTTALRWQKFYDAEADLAAAHKHQREEEAKATAASAATATQPGDAGDSSEKRVTIATPPTAKSKKSRVRRNPSGMTGRRPSSLPTTAEEGEISERKAPDVATSGDSPAPLADPSAVISEPTDDADADDDASSVSAESETAGPDGSEGVSDEGTTIGVASPTSTTAATASSSANPDEPPPSLRQPFSPTPPSPTTPPPFVAATAPLDEDDPSSTDPTTPHLPISFDPRLFGFILEFFQVVLHSIYQPRTFGDASGPGLGMSLPTGGEVGRLLEGVVPISAGGLLRAPSPQTVIVLREELDYFVVPGFAMDKDEVRDEGDYAGAPGWGGAQGGDDDQVNVDDPLAHLPPRRLLLLALLKRGCGRWLLGRRKVLEGREREFAGREGVVDTNVYGSSASDPQNKPILDTLAGATDLDGRAEWGYRELEMGKCRMVSLTMLRVNPKPATGADPASPGGPGEAGKEATSGGDTADVTSVVTQMAQGPFVGEAGQGAATRRPQRKCWWEVREVKCTLPEGLLDEVERRAAFVAVGPEDGATEEPGQSDVGADIRNGVGGMAVANGVTEGTVGKAAGDGSSASEGTTTAGKGKSVVGGSSATTGGDSVTLTQQTGDAGVLGDQRLLKGRDPALWWNRREQMVKLWVRRIWTLEYCTV